jgi:hypothetical protein
MKIIKNIFNSFCLKNLLCLKCEIEKKQKVFIGKHWILCPYYKITTLQEQIEREELVKDLYNQSLKSET